MNYVRLVILTLAVAVLSSSHALASERTRLNAEVLAPINAFLRAAQSGDINRQQKQYLPSITIVDDHPPFIWSGKNALDAYFGSFEPFAKNVKMTDLKVSLGAPNHVHIATMTAYVVVPVKATSKVNGKPFAEAGLLTFTLQKTDSGWKIATQSYAEDSQNGSNDPY